MMMVAPMAGQFMMPWLDGSSSFGSAGFGPACFGAIPLRVADVPYSWPALADVPAWPVNYGATEEAPQQFPMDAFASQAPEAEPLLGREVDVPAQVKMESATRQPETPMEAQRNTMSTASVACLRHRRGHECSAQDAQALAADWPNVNEYQTHHEEDSEAKARELAHGLLVQKQAGAGAEAQWTFERLAFASKVSSRAAQIMLEESSMNDAVALAAELRGHVRSAVQSKHANHVVQKITEVMPVARASFVVDELKGFAYEVARHPFGCRVLCRILEHLSENDLSTIELVEEVVAKDLEQLCFDSYGSFVARHVLEYGLPQHRQRVVKALRTGLVTYAKDKFGSHVLEAALRHAGLEDQQVLARELLGDKGQLVALASNQFGRHVVKALVSMPDGLKKEALDVLQPMEGQLKASRYGKSVYQAIRAATSA